MSVFIVMIMGKAALFQAGAELIKPSADILVGMGIAAQGDQSATQAMIEGEDIFIEVHTGGVPLQGDAPVNDPIG